MQRLQNEVGFDGLVIEVAVLAEFGVTAICCFFSSSIRASASRSKNALAAGSFTMGSPENELERVGCDHNAALKHFADFGVWFSKCLPFLFESPQHEVTISKPFAMGRFAITRGEFATFVQETNYATSDKCLTIEDGKTEERAGRSFRNPGFAQDDQHPVVCVNWDDAKAFASWLSKKTRKTYRLLSEAEREYATRAGSTMRYSFGNDEKSLCRYGNVADQTTKRAIKAIEQWQWTVADCDDGYAYTAPVGKFAANAFGIHDVHGNVAEWTEDCWNETYQGAPTDGSAWTSADCNNRMVRGGSWFAEPPSLRSAHRSDLRTGDRSSLIGFRLARALAP